MNSSNKISRRKLLKGAAAGGGALLLGKAAFPKGHGGPDLLPSTTVKPYAIPSRAGVEIKAILTAGEMADNGYRMVGIPDGLGALDCGGTFQVFMNHELTDGDSPGVSGPGIVRAHGSDGAFVSKWTIDTESLHVLKGEDLTGAGQAFTWDKATSKYVNGTTQWQRLCSADLPDEKALRHGNLGTTERIFLDGEEISGVPSTSAPHARFGSAWARIVTGPNAGQAWELPRLGKMSFENQVACPHSKKMTIVGLFDDGSVNPAAPAASDPSEVYIYIGTKQSSGNEIERAGLTNGKLYGLRLFRGGTLVTEESNTFGFGTAATGFIGTARFELAELGIKGDVSSWDGLQLQLDSIAKNVFRFQRPEDGAWDPRSSHDGDLYFVTTGAIAASPSTAINMNSRLWRVRFDDIDNPLQGGAIDILLTGNELPAPGWRMFDNITIDRHGRLLLQEDTGNNPWVARIWLYGLDNGSLTQIAQHDPALFDPNFLGPGLKGPNFITQDEESSGIIDAEHIFGRGWFLFDVQNHFSFKGATPPIADPFGIVEGGQLLAMWVDPAIGTDKKHGQPGHDEDEDEDEDED